MRALALGLGLALAGCEVPDTLFCETAGCSFSEREWRLLSTLAGLPAQPPEDPSNRYATDPRAAALGQQLYFDERISGLSTQVDMLNRPTPTARAPKGQPSHVSCATCHDPRRAGADFTSNPNQVSIGAGWYDVNSQQTVNAAYYKIIYWNGRSDSLWGQIAAVTESPVSVGGNRLAIAWLLQDKYRDAYNAIFTEHPLPLTGTSAELTATLDPRTGQCALVAGVCPAPCRAVPGPTPSCWPRFPLAGRPGKAGCDPANESEPFHDAYDCMATSDQKAVTRVLVNFSKAIAAYEQRLVSRDSRFDQFMSAGPGSTLLTPSERRGARLFVGKASCVDCHNTPLLSDSDFHNVGVAQVGPTVPTEADCPAGGGCDCVNGKNCLPWGAADGLARLQAQPDAGFTRVGDWSDDPGDRSRSAYYTRPLHDLKGAWRTPSLRDVELTAPYMHDGVYATLEEVVWAYNRGGASAGYSGKRSPRIKPLFLTDSEEADLVAFLRTLTGAALPSTLTSKPELPK